MAVKMLMMEMVVPKIWTGGQDLDGDGVFTWIGKVSNSIP